MRGAGRRRRRYRIRGVRLLVALLIVASCVTTAAFLGYELFVLEDIEVEGNVIYSDEQIENWVTSKDYSWNTLYIMYEELVSEQKEIPFVDSMEITLLSPTSIRVNVAEKGMLGYVYVPALKEYAYFDRDGFVIEISPDAVNSLARITGLGTENATLYEKLDISGGTLKSLITITQLLDKYDLEPESIYVNGSRFILSYGSIQADLGSGSLLNEKITRLAQILPRLEGHSGTLHLNTWSETSTDVTFTPGELTGIPSY